MTAPLKLTDDGVPLSRARRESALALVAPVFAVVVLGLASVLGRPGAFPAPFGGGGYAGETIAVTFGARLAPLCAVMLRNQYQTAMTACADLQKPLSPAERAWKEQGCLTLLEGYNGFAARVPAEVLARQGLPRQIPVAWLPSAVPL